MSAEFARQMWQLLEPLHAIVYFEPTARATYGEAGLRGYWMGYFASRAACMGAVSAEVVTAAFYNFHPRMVSRAIPDAWSFSSPEAVLAARLRVVDAAWRRVVGDSGGGTLDEAAELVLGAMEDVDVGGRVLFAAHKSLEVPDPAHLRLWHAATLYREYRGDGHIAALLANGCSGLEAHHLAVAAGTASRGSTQPHRGWTDGEWDAGGASLVERGFVSAEGDLTTEGAALRDRIERSTDELSSPPWEGLGERGRRRAVTLLQPVTAAVMRGEGIPFPNAMSFARS
jgi:hypothetical protein